MNLYLQGNLQLQQKDHLMQEEKKK